MGYLITLIDEIIGHKIIHTVVANLGRYDESQEDEKEAVYKILGILENILDVKPDATELIGKETYIFTWIIKRVSADVDKIDDNKFYASEI